MLWTAQPWHAFVIVTAEWVWYFRSNMVCSPDVLAVTLWVNTSDGQCVNNRLLLMMLHDGYKKLAWVSEITPVRTAGGSDADWYVYSHFCHVLPPFTLQGRTKYDLNNSPWGLWWKYRAVWSEGEDSYCITIKNVKQCNIKFIIV